MLAKRRRAHIGPAAKGAGEAARIEKTEFESDAPEIQADRLNQLDRELHAHLAEPCNVSPRHLRRKLSEACTTYEKLLDEVRMELAIKLIQENRLNLGRIAFGN